jgi:hypothetical protein
MSAVRRSKRTARGMVMSNLYHPADQLCLSRIVSSLQEN